MHTLDIEDRYLKMVKDILSDNLQNKGLVTVYAFGSRAKGRAKKFSDLDLAIDVHGEENTELVWHLMSEFEESDLPFKVDVIDLNDVAPTFYDAIKEDLIELYKTV